MFQYDLILCQSVFAQYIRVIMAWESEYEANAMLKAIINQHHVVLSDNILSAYEQAFDRDSELQDVFMNFICNEAYVSGGRFKMVLDEQGALKNHDDLLIATSKSTMIDKPYVVCGECDIQSQLEKKMRPAKPTYLSMLLQCNIYQKVRRISVPFSVQAGDGDQCDVYSSWFGDVFFNERNIHIFDPYIINEAGLASLSRYYFPRLGKGTCVFIYTDTQNAEDYGTLKGTIDALADRFKIKILVYDRINSLHGRHIFFGSYHVILDHGLDFLDAKNNKVTDCSIELKKEAGNTLLYKLQKKYIKYYESQ